MASPDFNSSARAQMGGGGVSPTHSHLGTGRKWAITPRPGIFTAGCDAVRIGTGGWVGSRVGLDGTDSLSPGFDLRTVQPVASCCTDRAIPTAMCW